MSYISLFRHFFLYNICTRMTSIELLNCQHYVSYRAGGVTYVLIILHIGHRFLFSSIKWPQSSNGKEVKDVFEHPGVRGVGVDSTRYRPLAVRGVGYPTAGLNFETGFLSRHFIAKILLNVTLNHNKSLSDRMIKTFGDNHTQCIPAGY